MKYLLIILLLVSSCSTETRKEKLYREHIDLLQNDYDTLYKYSVGIAKISLKEFELIDSLKKELKKCKGH